MPRTGKADLPLHPGKAPRWLFSRMKRLSGAIIEAIVSEFGTAELLRRLSDPYWFQSLGCLLGFDWHSSGLTTTLTGAIKLALSGGLDRELGFFAAGGKGSASRRTPLEIKMICDLTGADPAPLIYSSRMSAKVDSAALQDGYQLYHHAFFFDAGGSWCVIQQGMNEKTRYARRYHWLSEKIRDFVEEPHAAIASERTGFALDMTARESGPARHASAILAAREPDANARDLIRMRELNLPREHRVLISSINPLYIRKTLVSLYENPPRDFEALLSQEGVGPKTIRALALLSDVIYGARPSFHDPMVYSFAHGGKDGHPYPVNREVYDRTIAILERAIRKARLGQREETEALRRLSRYF
ncbi:MAG: DUF763 domain-containing protein [candidate division WOR-3 bacterium]